uniref:Dihydrodipicolinate reductase N-terminal domain-containing protein n=1 Tax=Ananas comosus var. bracteatus TaxID=296719 RepID=A0A6V7QLW2_ANACO|nr:unnamed protein product [Ananas comosus var. bracteatus]
MLTSLPHSAAAAAAVLPRRSRLLVARRAARRPISVTNAVADETLDKASAATGTRTHPLLPHFGANLLSLTYFVNGCTGKMGKAVAEAAVSAGLQLVPVTFSSKEKPSRTLQVGSMDMHVHGPSEREYILSSVLDEFPNLVLVDYTVPDAVNDNAELYCKLGVPFVMGTTGGDREMLYKTVQDANVYAVLSPQMGKQVVAFLAAMEIMAEQFPGAFSGYHMEGLTL